VRTDAKEQKMPFSLDEFRAVLDGVPDDDDAAKAMLMAKVAKMKGAPMEEPAEPVMDADPKAGEMVPKADMDAMKMRADAAEAGLKTLRAAKLRTDAAEVAADIKRAGIVVDGFDPANPTAESVGKARAAVVDAALTRLRTDSIDPSAPQGGRPDPRPSKGDKPNSEPLRLY
jgi:hypothetical protein